MSAWLISDTITKPKVLILALRSANPAHILGIHHDEGWRLHQPASCGKVVSTKVGCGRFNGKLSRFAPGLLVKGGFDDGADSLQTTQQSNNAQTRPHWGCCFIDMCARNRAGHKFDAGSSPATTVWASVCRVCRTFISSRARPSLTSRFASWPNEYPFQWQNIPGSRRPANSCACAGLWMAAAIHFDISK